MVYSSKMFHLFFFSILSFSNFNVGKLKRMDCGKLDAPLSSVAKRQPRSKSELPLKKKFNETKARNFFINISYLSQ